MNLEQLKQQCEQSLKSSPHSDLLISCADLMQLINQVESLKESVSRLELPADYAHKLRMALANLGYASPDSTEELMWRSPQLMRKIISKLSSLDWMRELKKENEALKSNTMQWRPISEIKQIGDKRFLLFANGVVQDFVAEHQDDNYWFGTLFNHNVDELSDYFEPTHFCLIDDIQKPNTTIQQTLCSITGMTEERSRQLSDAMVEAIENTDPKNVTFKKV